VDDALVEQLIAVYRDLHAHPELSGQEIRTAAVASSWLSDLGYEMIDGVGGTGVVGVLRTGPGPVVLLRADMDALPVTEATGLPYTSTVEDVMHACGHDLHVACLLGATHELASARGEWAGTVVAVFQPAEEAAAGAQAMIDDGLYARVPRPAVVLGQHVAPIPAGFIGLRGGPAFAATDTLRVTMFGSGGHGSRPEATVDPVVMAASTVLRWQGIVSREVAAGETAVLTVGALNAGSRANIVPDQAEMLLSVRTFDDAVRERVLAAIERIARAEAQASGAPEPPTIEALEVAPPVVNDPHAVARTRPALEQVVGPGRVIDPGPVTGSEDVGLLASAAEAPIVFWLLGGADAALFADASTPEQIARIVARLPSNHSPHYAPVPEPTLRIGSSALTTAARQWLAG
jgi:amidohydrolase